MKKLVIAIALVAVTAATTVSAQAGPRPKSKRATAKKTTPAAAAHSDEVVTETTDACDVILSPEVGKLMATVKPESRASMSLQPGEEKLLPFVSAAHLVAAGEIPLPEHPLAQPSMIRAIRDAWSRNGTSTRKFTQALLVNEAARAFEGVPGVTVETMTLLKPNGEMETDPRNFFSTYSRIAHSPKQETWGFAMDEFKGFEGALAELPASERVIHVIRFKPSKMKSATAEDSQQRQLLDYLIKASEEKDDNEWAFFLPRKIGGSKLDDTAYLVIPSIPVLQALMDSKYGGFSTQLEPSLSLAGHGAEPQGDTALIPLSFPELGATKNSPQAYFLGTLLKMREAMSRTLANRSNPDRVIELKSFAGVSLGEGARFKTAAGKIYQVKKVLISGNDRRVYKIVDEEGTAYVFKSARNRNKDDIEGIGKDASRAIDTAKIGLAHAELVEYNPEGAYLIRRFTKGEQGDEWIKRWEKEGAPKDSPILQGLVDICIQSVKAGAYVGKLDPEDMIYADGKWFIVDSGRVKFEHEPWEVAWLYANRTTELWVPKLTEKKAIERFEAAMAKIQDARPMPKDATPPREREKDKPVKVNVPSDASKYRGGYGY